MKSLNRTAERKSYNRNDWPSRPSRRSNNRSFSAFKTLNSEHSGLCKIRGQVVANTKAMIGMREWGGNGIGIPNSIPIHVIGDVVLDLSKMTNQTIKLGGGLRQDGDVISVMKAGKLRFSKPNKYWVESSHKRYVPSAGDNVLGIVVDAKADNFLVDIKGPMLAFLPVLAFEGGTRRNIPKFEMGTLLYVRVLKANTGMNPELSCMDASGKAAEYGPLKDGFMFESSTGLSRTLLSTPTCPVLETLGKKLAFEIAVGLNGRVWVIFPAELSVYVALMVIVDEVLDQHSRDTSCITDMYEREDDRNTYRHRVMKSDFNYKLSPILVPVRILIQIKTEIADHFVLMNASVLIFHA
ncbi:UNVERIFIED_CONTAM: putative exosome complex component rrp40 [Sesamum calycinum]|uniref:Ribosomal RNA-processing protein 40 n=1 Tax=Sesamum calycinum TaxID=2727403 RepID=A0AAW2L9M4_9LAMI